MNGAPLELVTRRFVDALMAAGGPPIYTLSPADARAPVGRPAISLCREARCTYRGRDVSGRPLAFQDVIGNFQNV
jgi:hypothetical protein